MSKFRFDLQHLPKQHQKIIESKNKNGELVNNNSEKRREKSTLIESERCNKFDIIDFKRPHVGFLNGHKIKIESIIESKEEKEYEIKIEALNQTLEKISNIPIGITVKFEIYDKIDWNINIIRQCGSGVIKNIKEDKENWICSGGLLIKVIG